MRLASISVTSMEFHVSVLRTEDAAKGLHGTVRAKDVYVFSTRHGMRCMNSHIRAWLQELFRCGRTQNATVYFDLDHPPRCSQHEWWRFTGCLPQLRIHLVFLASPHTPLPAWASALVCTS